MLVGSGVKLFPVGKVCVEQVAAVPLLGCNDGFAMSAGAAVDRGGAVVPGEGLRSWPRARSGWRSCCFACASVRPSQSRKADVNGVADLPLLVLEMLQSSWDRRSETWLCQELGQPCVWCGAAVLLTGLAKHPGRVLGG